MILKHRTTFLFDLELSLVPHEELLPREGKPSDLAAYFIQRPSKGGKPSKGGDKYALLNVIEDRMGRQAMFKKHMTLEMKSNFTLPRSEQLSEWPLLMASSCSWRQIDPKSRAQKWNDISRATIVEYWKLQRYRKPLISLTSAALFRDKIEKRMSKWATTKLRQGSHVKEWRFWDHVDVDLKKIRAPVAKTADEQDAVDRERMMLHTHITEINKIIRAVQRANVSKENADDGEVEDHVHTALKSMIEVMSRDVRSTTVILTMLQTLCDNGDRLRFRLQAEKKKLFIGGSGELARMDFMMPNHAPDRAFRPRDYGRSHDRSTTQFPCVLTHIWPRPWDGGWDKFPFEESNDERERKSDG
jgi:hypothetical protein